MPKLFSAVLSVYLNLIEKYNDETIVCNGWPGIHWLKSVIVLSETRSHYNCINLLTWYNLGQFLSRQIVYDKCESALKQFNEVNLPQIKSLDSEKIKVTLLLESIEKVYHDTIKKKVEKEKELTNEENNIILEMNRLNTDLKIIYGKLDVLECPVAQVRAIRYLMLHVDEKIFTTEQNPRCVDIQISLDSKYNFSLLYYENCPGKPNQLMFKCEFDKIEKTGEVPTKCIHLFDQTFRSIQFTSSKELFIILLNKYKDWITTLILDDEEYSTLLSKLGHVN